MRTVLCFLLCLAAPAAASAQAGARPSPPGLTLGEPGWERVFATFWAGASTRTAGSGMRSTLHHPTPLPGNRLRYRSGAPVRESVRPRDVSGIWRRAFVRLTNTGATAVKSVRMDFVFTDAATGAEVLRIGHRSRKRVKPGESYVYDKTVNRSERTLRGDGARLSVEFSEVAYADGTVWRP